MHDYFKPGDTVVFRAYAVDGKNHKILTEAKYFYAHDPGQPNVKFKYDPKAKTALGQYAWIGTWTVPSTYQLGLVNFKVLVQSKTKRRGSFVQMPVATSQLTITNTPPATGTTPPGAIATPTGTDDTVVYADSVNGTRPAGAAPRPIGCTQTNVFKRGEQFVLRTWGFDLKTKTVLSLDNVTEAHFTVPGQPNVTLNWGTHGDGEGLLLDELLEHPDDVPARRHHREGQLHADDRQGRDPRLPDHDHPVARTDTPRIPKARRNHEHQDQDNHPPRRGADRSAHPVGTRPRDTRPR